MDSLEANAAGGALADAVELNVMRRVTAANPSDVSSVVMLRSVKSAVGDTGAPSGLVGLSCAIRAVELGAHGPGLHLRQLFSLGRDVNEEETEQRLCLPVEALGTNLPRQLSGVSSFGSAGTNVHFTVWGSSEHRTRLTGTPRPIRWFPLCPNISQILEEHQTVYDIIGTWSAWERTQRMVLESPGVWVYTMTMGENNWEAFQILVDGDEDKILHPSTHFATQDSSVLGPTVKSRCGRVLTWCVSGESRKVRLVNHLQDEELWERERCEGPEAVRNIGDYHVYFPRDLVPEGHQSESGDPADASRMPVKELNEHVGVPGDRYTLRLSVNGKLRRVSWAKLKPGEQGANPPDEFRHVLYLVGDHSFWSFQAMQAGPDGVHTAEVQLLRDGRSSLHVVQDKDWDQVFVPKDQPLPLKPLEPDAPASQGWLPALGPGSNSSKTWELTGKAGDVFEVMFRRTVTTDGGSTSSISWSRARQRPPHLETTAQDHRYFLVGSWSGFVHLDEMSFDEARGAFFADAEIGRSGSESFQILVNSSWLAVVHPNTPMASFRDKGHEVQGPDRNSRLHWTIGRRKDDEVRPGDIVRVFLEIQGSLPRSVWW